MIRANVPTNIEQQIKSILDNSNELIKCCDFGKAESLLLKAWFLLPEPKLSWDYHPQILAKLLMNCYTHLKDAGKAHDWMITVREAYEAPHIGDDPCVDFWEAQMNYELGLQEEAFNSFHSIYKKFKKRPFKGRDSKYLDFYFTKAKEKQFI